MESDNVSGVEFHDVYMVGCFSELAEDFNPKFSDALGELHVEIMEFIERSERYREDQQGSRGLFRVFVSFGARWASEEAAGQPGDEVDDSDQDDDRILATIEAGFVVEYVIPDDISQEFIDDYALQNSVPHAFPYWRDYLLGQCAKLRMNTARLPRRIVAPLGVIKI